MYTSAGNIDKDSELNRIEREITKLENDISLLSKNLEMIISFLKLPPKLLTAKEINYPKQEMIIKVCWSKKINCFQ